MKKITTRYLIFKIGREFIKVNLVEFLSREGIVVGKTEAKRLLQQGAIEITFRDEEN